MSIAAIDLSTHALASQQMYPAEGGEPGPDREPARTELRLELARELHDQVAQNLTTMLVRLENFKVEQAGRAGVQLEIATLEREARQSLHGIRQILHDLRGRPAGDVDLVQRLRTEIVPAFSARSGIPARVHVSRHWPDVLPAALSRQLVRVVQEALANVHLHSGARRAEVDLVACSEGELRVVIRDDGKGFEESGYGRAPGDGLLGIRERVNLIGGRLSIRTRPGRGCRVVVTLPRATWA